ncbi:hypothetical protein RhiirA4_486176 [Rhizophagus irregularis]|uniref:Uncharacterized protein n=1 Tax=Rhizophagus irregularis TaxID=588596 RepID=A0A2I1HR27_9GLOM|nr:hypothetical protein RhiirA4_486176 [Rhizophagus irregularis]
MPDKGLYPRTYPTKPLSIPIFNEAAIVYYYYHVHENPGKKSDSPPVDVFELVTNDIFFINLQHYLHVYRQKKSQLLILNQFPTY